MSETYEEAFHVILQSQFRSAIQTKWNSWRAEILCAWAHRSPGWSSRDVEIKEEVLSAGMHCFKEFYFVFLCMHMNGGHRGEKRALDSMDLELQEPVRHHVEAGNWTQVLCQSSQVILTSEPAPSIHLKCVCVHARTRACTHLCVCM